MLEDDWIIGYVEHVACMLCKFSSSCGNGNGNIEEEGQSNLISR